MSDKDISKADTEATSETQEIQKPDLRLVDSLREDEYPYSARINLCGNMRGNYPFELGEAWTGAVEEDVERIHTRTRIKHAIHMIGVEDYKILEDGAGFSVYLKSHEHMDDFRVAMTEDDDFTEEKLIELAQSEQTPQKLREMHQMFNEIIAKHKLEAVCEAEIEEEHGGVVVITRGKRGRFGFWRAFRQETDRLIAEQAPQAGAHL